MIKCSNNKYHSNNSISNNIKEDSSKTKAMKIHSYSSSSMEEQINMEINSNNSKMEHLNSNNMEHLNNNMVKHLNRT